MIAFVLAYIGNFFVGKSANFNIAKQWLKSIERVLEEQFVEVGAYDPPLASRLYKESHSVYKVYATGRNNCSGILATLDVQIFSSKNMFLNFF
jgi:hypothetical protein